MLLLAERLENARRQTPLRILARRIAHHLLLHGQLLLEQQRIVPVKAHASHVPALKSFHNRASIA